MTITAGDLRTAARYTGDAMQGRIAAELDRLADDVEAGRVSLEPVVVRAVACRSIDCAHAHRPTEPKLPLAPSWLKHGV